jgi:putative redox protein
VSIENQPGTVIVTDAGTGKYTQRITAGEHVFLADEPVSVGGEDAGPNPYDLLLSALGTCTAMTIRMYADRKGIPLERTTISLRHDRIHAQDCEDCETESGLLSQITRDIHLDGDLDDEQRAKLMAIADRCPVHRTLTSEIVVRTNAV